MSSDLLRKAAETLRERANAATSGPWWIDGITVRGGSEGRGVASATNAYRPNAHHIATMHPGVGLALAEWLDTARADLWAHGPLCECGSGCLECDDSLWQPHVRRALAVGRLIVGESND